MVSNKRCISYLPCGPQTPVHVVDKIALILRWHNLHRADAWNPFSHPRTNLALTAVSGGSHWPELSQGYVTSVLSFLPSRCRGFRILVLSPPDEPEVKGVFWCARVWLISLYFRTILIRSLVISVEDHRALPGKEFLEEKKQG